MQAVTTAASLEPERPQSWLEFVRAELAPLPGRFNAVVRIVVAVSIVLVTSVTLEVPFLGLSCFVVMFLTMLTPGVTTQNSVFVAIASTVAMVVLTISIAATLVIFRFTLDYPGLRLGAMALTLFVGMYASRVMAAPVVGVLLGLVVLVTQAFADALPDPESLVRTVLWVWVAIVYSAAVSVGVNLMLLPADPEPLLRREAAERLRTVARAITAPRGSADARNAAAALARFAQEGSAPLLKLIGLAEVRNSGVKPLHAERTAKVLLLDHLIASAALLADLAVEPTIVQHARLERVAETCERYAMALLSGAALPAPPPAHKVDDRQSALTPILAELEGLVRELPLAERPAIDQVGQPARPLVADAFTNPLYAHFALKVTLAAMFCYIAYTAVDWFGIHTCIITCIFVALGSAGATIHKASLRLIGCAIGGVLALASIVFVLPHMTTIAGLTLLVAAVTAPAAWIAMGGERTAYIGLQMAFAFYLAALAGFAPPTDVTEVRDRLVGIVFGVVVMALVFSYIWPERAGTGMLRSLATALRRMGELALGAGDSRGVRAAAWQAFDQADRLAEIYVFEPEALASPGAEKGRRVRLLIDLTRRVLLAQAALAQLRTNTKPASIDAAADAARNALGRSVADVLAAVARSIETSIASEGHADLRTPLAALGAASRASGDGLATWLDGELALSEALVERVEALQQAAGAT